MNTETIINKISDLLKTNLQNFCKNEDTQKLSPELAAKMINQTKKLISQIGSITLEHFFESYDCRESSFEENGELYRHKYKGSREFLTSVGKIRVNRNVYQRDKGGKSIAPLDRCWNMEHEYISEDVQEGLLFSAAHNTPEETAQLFEKISMFQIHPTTIKKLINKTGDFIEESKEQILDNIYQEEEIENTPDVMVCSLDGVNVLLNEKGVKKGRPTERPVEEKKGQENSAYKNAMCGTVSLYKVEKEDDKNTPKRIMTKYTTRMPQERYQIFKNEFEREIEHISQSNPQKKILLTDAHTSIQGYIKDNPKFADFEWMIDFYHASEHLSKLSELIFGKNNKKGQKWYLQKRNELKNTENGAGKVIRSAEYYIKTLLTSKSSIKKATKELNYFKKHRKRMNYKLHLDNGWPIGSGVVEAACKSVVKQRMCRSGQRWTRTGGQRILNLRTFVKSDRWNHFWEEYTQMKLKKCA